MLKISIPPEKIDIDNKARFGYTEGYCYGCVVLNNGDLADLDKRIEFKKPPS